MQRRAGRSRRLLLRFTQPLAGLMVSDAHRDLAVGELDVLALEQLADVPEDLAR